MRRRRIGNSTSPPAGTVAPDIEAVVVPVDGEASAGRAKRSLISTSRATQSTRSDTRSRPSRTGSRRAATCGASSGPVERVEVVYTSGAGAGSRRGPSGMEFAREEDVRATLFPDRLPGDDLHSVGDVHSHPHGRTGTPSQPDLDSWASVLWNRDRSRSTSGPRSSSSLRRLAALPRLGHEARRASRRVRLPASLGHRQVEVLRVTG